MRISQELSCLTVQSAALKSFSQGGRPKWGCVKHGPLLLNSVSFHLQWVFCLCFRVSSNPSVRRLLPLRGSISTLQLTLPPPPGGAVTNDQRENLPAGRLILFAHKGTAHWSSALDYLNPGETLAERVGVRGSQSIAAKERSCANVSGTENEKSGPCRLGCDQHRFCSVDESLGVDIASDPHCSRPPIMSTMRGFERFVEPLGPV
jgi:hypothetical protein